MLLKLSTFNRKDTQSFFAKHSKENLITFFCVNFSYHENFIIKLLNIYFNKKAA